MGKVIILVGIVLIIIGAIVQFGPNIPFLGKLPGDIHIKGERYSFYFPIATSILISIVLSLILYLINKFR